MLAYEGSRSDGPFLSPLRYKRDNLTGSYTRRAGSSQTFGVRVQLSRNDFFSSGQIPLDEVAAGRLDRFGFVEPDGGGRARTGQAAFYYRRETSGGGSLKLDAFVTRSLFDLFSNFTFFLVDEERGDEIQQHDSRLQEGANAQYLRPVRLFGAPGLLVAGGNVHASQINVGLYRSEARAVRGEHAGAGAFAELRGIRPAGVRLRGRPAARRGRPALRPLPLRCGRSRRPCFVGRGGGRALAAEVRRGRQALRGRERDCPLQLRTRDREPGRARGRARALRPEVSTTDFSMLGAAYNSRRLSASAGAFLIDTSNQQVYIPDDGSVGFAGPGRAYGYEFKASARLLPWLTLGGGVTRVTDAFYRGTSPRVYVDSAPHVVGNAELTVSDWRGLRASLRYRHASDYRLDGEDASVRASGLDVLDLGVAKRVNRRLDLNLSVGNMTNKRYYETQNYFESRVRSGEPAAFRVHGTPGYPLTFTAGFTLRLGVD